MNRILLSLLLTLCVPLIALADEYKVETLIEEYERLYTLVEKLEPDYEIGFLKGKTYGDVELLWDLALTPKDYDIIRLYHEHSDGSEFVISFFRGRHLIKGRNVIRRYVGPVITRWRNDTIDYDRAEYIGRQGMAEIKVTESDLKVLSDWQITLFQE